MHERFDMRIYSFSNGLYRWIWGICWIVATFVLLYCYKPFNWNELGSHMCSMGHGWLAAALAANIVITPLAIAEWYCLIPRRKRIPLPRLGEIVALTGAAENTVPCLGGHAISFGMFVGRGNLDAILVSSLFVLDQTCRAIVKIMLVFLVLIVIPVPRIFYTPIAILAAGVVLLVASIYFVASFAGRRKGIFFQRVSSALNEIQRPWALAFCIFLVVLMKCCEAFSIYCIQYGIGVELPFSSVLLVLLAINLAGLISLAPGNIGLFDAAVVLAYSYLGVDVTMAVTMALLIHACALIPPIGIGYIVLGWRTVVARSGDLKR